MKYLIIAVFIIVVALVMKLFRGKGTPDSDSDQVERAPAERSSEESAPAKTVSREVTFMLSEDRKATCGDKNILLPRGTEVSGTLRLETFDGPLGIREYDNASFLRADFAFTHDGQIYQYSGIISPWDLWAPNGTGVAKEQSGFRDETGQLDGMMDGRDDWEYILPDGSTHSNRLKYTSCHFWVMVKPSALDVKCKYYVHNSNIADYVTIFYSRSLADLLLLKDTSVFNDAEGKPEDYSLHDGETITLKKL